jgi:hypothetical protein
MRDQFTDHVEDLGEAGIRIHVQAHDLGLSSSGSGSRS